MFNTLSKLSAIGSVMTQQVMKEEKPSGYHEPVGKPMCRILSMSGGGSKGAYEVGVINTFVKNVPAPDN